MDSNKHEAAGFNDLPTEILIHIINLSVAGAVAEDYGTLSRQILLSLALVCKLFTVPAQRGLWTCMDSQKCGQLKKLLKDGVGKDRIVESFCVEYDCDDKAVNSNVRRFLKGVKEVWHLDISIPSYCSYIEKGAADFASISSLERELIYIPLSQR